MTCGQSSLSPGHPLGALATYARICGKPALSLLSTDGFAIACWAMHGPAGPARRHLEHILIVSDDLATSDRLPHFFAEHPFADLSRTKGATRLSAHLGTDLLPTIERRFRDPAVRYDLSTGSIT